MKQIREELLATYYWMIAACCYRPELEHDYVSRTGLTSRLLLFNRENACRNRFSGVIFMHYEQRIEQTWKRWLAYFISHADLRGVDAGLCGAQSAVVQLQPAIT